MSFERVLRVSGLGKRYRTYSNPRQRLREMLLPARGDAAEPVDALQDVSFELGRGEILGVIGPNGSGKSTLLQIIARTLQPSSGSVWMEGRLTALLELGAGVDPEMTGRENIMLMGQTYGLNAGEVRARTEAIVRFSELGAAIDHPVKTYSSGMFVRLAFSVSTALDPDVLIVDEALSVGDVGFQLKCLDRLEALIAEGASILLASHDLQLVKNYCTRAVCLQDGRLIADGEPEPVTERYLQLMHDRNRGMEEPGMSWDRGAAGGGRMSSEGGVIEHVEVRSESGAQSFRFGEKLEVSVRGSLESGALRPVNATVAVIVRDIRGYNVYGLSADVSSGVRVEGNAFGVEFEIPVRLATGRYTLTAKLEDRRSESAFRLIDKHVGICFFDVDASGAEPFLGTADLGGCVVRRGSEG